MADRLHLKHLSGWMEPPTQNARGEKNRWYPSYPCERLISGNHTTPKPTMVPPRRGRERVCQLPILRGGAKRGRKPLTQL